MMMTAVIDLRNWSFLQTLRTLLPGKYSHKCSVRTVVIGIVIEIAVVCAVSVVG